MAIEARRARRHDIRDKRRLTQSVARTLLNRYAKEHSAEYQAWIAHELDPGGVGPTWRTLYGFIAAHCRYEDRTDLARAALQLRGLVCDDLAASAPPFELSRLMRDMREQG